MRVSQETRQQTRTRILGAAHKLLSKRGFERTSTREIAEAAEIASGTLFNYFATKEALVETLVEESLEGGFAMFNRSRKPGQSLAEDLFQFIACGLRSLASHRTYISPTVFGRALGPLANASPGSARTQLEAVTSLLHSHGANFDDPFVLHLYWTLYLGVLSFWIRDESPKQEDTLALLDRSVNLFVSSLGKPKESQHGA